MGFGIKVFITIVISTIFAYLANQCLFCSQKPIPELDFNIDRYWGKQIIKKNGQFPDDDIQIKPFKVEYKLNQVEDYKHRLASTNYMQPIEDANFDYGFSPTMLKKVVNYWLTKFDFNKTLKELNQFPQFITQIEGINVHFLHIKPKQVKQSSTPLMLVHGWPGSFYEFYKIIPLLSNDYELVVPSIPGYGFSEPAYKKGFSAGHVARIFVKLMKRLGHERFFYHGGDWGAVIGRYMAISFPENVIGYHSSGLIKKFTWRTIGKHIIGRLAPNLVFESEEEIQFDRGCIRDWFIGMLEESGYMHLQSTKPDTIGSLLVDSPAGLTAYILEKFVAWVNLDYVNRVDGGLTEKFTLDELLTNVWIYWISGNAGHATRLYKETIPIFFKHEKNMPKISKQVKLGFTLFPNEPFGRVPKYYLDEYAENVAYYSIVDRGGHFAVFEEPQLAAKELRAFIQTVEK